MATNENTFAHYAGANAGGVRSVASFQRPANTTAYAANDVVYSSTSTAGVLLFPGVGSSGLINGAYLLIAATLATPDLELWVFDSGTDGTEPKNALDNAAFSLNSGDLGRLVGVFEFLDTNKKLAGTFQYTEAVAKNPVAYTATGGSSAGNLYGILVTRGAFTPASSTAFVAALHVEIDKA